MNSFNFAQSIWESEVRDYELDAQGIVNNANYFHYFEHARHRMFLENLNLSFVEIHQKGFDFVLVESKINFKSSLKSGDFFKVYTEMKPMSKVRLVFEQKIVEIKSENRVAEGVNVVALISAKTKRPVGLEKFSTCLNS